MRAADGVLLSLAYAASTIILFGVSDIEAEAEALSIPMPSLIVAADDLGVRTQRGRCWLPE